MVIPHFGIIILKGGMFMEVMKPAAQRFPQFRPLHPDVYSLPTHDCMRWQYLYKIQD